MYLFFGHVYAAEALCALNMPKEAAEQLTVYLRDDNDVELPYSVENHEKAPVEKDRDGETQSLLLSEDSPQKKLSIQSLSSPRKRVVLCMLT
jgi:CCR4-NOT transcription complex subunit 10